jgi:hypothetical protein
VITGYNTDVKHKNRVFHIQTEDKGEANPYVESLVYVGGEILATKRTSYAEVIKEGRDDHAVQDLMEQQHRTMIAAIQRGRFDGPNGAVLVPEGMSPPGAPPAEKPAPAPPRAAASPAASSAKTPPPMPAASPPARASRQDKGAPEKAARAPRVEKGEETAVSGQSPLLESDRSLDQMVLDYLVSEEMPDEVELALSPAPDFVSGRSVQTRLKATSGSPPRPLGGATVQVRILSTSARASTAFEGKTAADGSCYVSFMVPAFPNGTAAAVIRVTGPRASSEVQYPIKRK